MFSKIFSEKTMTTLKKVPIFVWYIIFGIASLFSAIYGLKEIGVDYIEVFSEKLPDVSAEKFLLILYPMMFVLYIVIFEIIAHLVYNLMYRRFLLTITQSDFVLKMRLMIIMSNLCIGIISLVFFLLPQIAMVTSAIVNPFFLILFLGFFLYEICSKSVPNNNGALAYTYVARLYLGIMITLSIFNVVMLFTIEGVVFMEYLASTIKVILLVAMSGFAYLQYNKLKNLPKDPPQSGGSVIEEVDNTVFKDFGF